MGDSRYKKDKSNAIYLEFLKTSIELQSAIISNKTNTHPEVFP